MIEVGNYRARATSAELGFTAGGKEQVAVQFELLDHPGQFLTWYGYFTEKTEERTLQSLRYCGWTSDDISDLSTINTNEVALAIIQEPDPDGVLRAKVNWVNRLGGGGPALKAVMPDTQKRAFAARMKAAAITSRKDIQAPAQQQQKAMPARTGKARPANAGDAFEDDDLAF